MGGSAGGMNIPGLEIPGMGMPGGASGGAGGDGKGDGEGAGECGGGMQIPGDYGTSSECGEEGDGTSGQGADAGGAGGEGGAAGSGGAGGVGGYPGETDAERAERLGKELDESVGGFDDVLAEEQREISTVGRNTEGFGGGAGGGRPGGRVGLGQQGGGGNSTTGTVSILNPTDGRQATVDSMSEDEIQARLPEDIVENVGDDIIAKQLYEAALAEDDPELRERLWDEYRKYNGL